MSNPIHDNNSFNAAAAHAEFESLYIPPNLDPRLLALWIEREQIALDLNQQKTQPPLPREPGRSLVRLFPAYIGIAVMCVAILLGVVHSRETTEILQTACITFLIYTFIGVFVGIIAEHCVNDSVETLLRDFIRRRQTEQDIDTISAP